MIRFIVLSLLRMKEMHGYEIQGIIQTSRMEQWANLLSGSLYHALGNLEKEGKIEAVREERTGARIRKIYRITALGEQEFHAQLKAGLLTPPGETKSEFALALPWISELAKEEARELLARNIDRIRSQIESWQYGYELKGKDNPLIGISMEHGIEKMKMDVAYLKRVMELL
ncbi:DNA-binding PadR family transcriptional regulator [Paenibacillus mucilaginosus]|uniref:PadR family transcriptional regulator n=1 Tax=Paenibacillus mucilaginosus TaxID=61624 RepID=UPI003D203CF4